MEFTDKKAKEIISKHGLADSTIKVWKTRGKIPDKYKDETYIKPIPLTKTQKLLHDKTILLLKNDKLRRTELSRLSGIPEQKFIDCVNSKSSMQESELIKIKKAINEARIEFKKAVDQLANKEYFSEKNDEILKKALLHPLVVVTRLHGYQPGSTDQHRVTDWLRDKQHYIPEYIKQHIINEFAILILETAL